MDSWFVEERLLEEIEQGGCVWPSLSHWYLASFSSEVSNNIADLAIVVAQELLSWHFSCDSLSLTSSQVFQTSHSLQALQLRLNAVWSRQAAVSSSISVAHLHYSLVLICWRCASPLYGVRIVHHALSLKLGIKTSCISHSSAVSKARHGFLSALSLTSEHSQTSAFSEAHFWLSYDSWPIMLYSLSRI